MKKLFSMALLCLCSLSALAQEKDVTKFLGIPVDGTKAEMIRKLKEKGFRESPYSEEALIGEFNGTNVNVYVVTDNNKVSRIMVADASPIGERDIQIRFNTLCRQFENNPKYFASPNNERIPESEDLSYEITVHKKRYEAVFYQKSVNDFDSSSMQMRSVWFMINELYGKYYIIIFYDNEYNRANGEDL